MRICVFLSAADLGGRYADETRRFATHLVGRGHSLVWGGSDVGLMKVLADGVQGAGGTIHGVSVEFLRHVVRPGADSMVVTADLGERKARLLADADAVVVLVGGTGTLDEATDLIELKKHGLSRVPLVFVNTDGFYDGLRQQCERMQRDGFLPVPLDDVVRFVDDSETALELVESMSPDRAGRASVTGPDGPPPPAG